MVTNFLYYLLFTPTFLYNQNFKLSEHEDYRKHRIKNMKMPCGCWSVEILCIL